MTKRQKDQTIHLIKNLMNLAGFVQDHYGNYKATAGNDTYRIKLKPINIRIERKTSYGWNKVISQPIVKLDIGWLATWMTRFQIKQS